MNVIMAAISECIGHISHITPPFIPAMLVYKNPGTHKKGLTDYPDFVMSDKTFIYSNYIPACSGMGRYLRAGGVNS
jgi:hypothetical protein